jgi:hypothetical protein
MRRMRYPTCRPERPFFFICIAVAAVAALTSPTTARAYDWNFNIFDDPGSYRLMVSPITGHFRPSPEHKHVYALGLERQRDDGRIVGAAYFRNSFGQPSAYVYVGHHFEGVFGVPQWNAQWSAGLLYGYVGKYKNKVPLNVNGFSPGALISTGWQFTKSTSVELHMLGDAAVMLQLSYRLP